MENKKIGSFTGLRFIMIMVIVFAHFDFLNDLPVFGSFYVSHLKRPGLATDFFFILSGFGMMLGSIKRHETEQLATPTLKECFQYGIFHVKKIYPVYLITTAVCFASKIFGTLYSSSINSSFLLNNTINLIVNVVLLQSATGMTFFTLAYNPVGWFLSCLFCIYLISPFCIFLLRKISKNIQCDILFLIFNILMTVFTAFIFNKIEIRFSNIQGIPDINLLTYASPYRRIFYVLCGMNIAMIFQRIKDYLFFNNTKIMTVFEISISVIAFLSQFFRTFMLGNFGIFNYAIDVTICSLFILIYSHNNGLFSKILNFAFFQKLGNLSMYIFLIHCPFIVLPTYYQAVLFGKHFEYTPLSTTIFAFFILLLTFLLSELAFYIQNKKTFIKNSEN